MSTTLVTPVADSGERAELSTRLASLDQLTRIGAERVGPEGFSADLIAASTDVLTRADERLRLSSNHTVVSLAGGTGSGKSSLFNQLAGADFSPVGVTRPVTREAHACVWGVAGSGSLMEWLGVPRRYRYARASALSTGEQTMNGLVLLDLPDHDSVVGHATDLVDKLVGLSDLIVWILDPQKYADAAVHRRFLVPLAGHSEVLAVVLNQSDLLTAAEVEDCVHDLRRLLDSEGLHDVQILVTSAKTGDGIEELRKLLTQTVSARRAAAARIAADVDVVVAQFEPYGERLPDTANWPDGGRVPDGRVPDGRVPDVRMPDLATGPDGAAAGWDGAAAGWDGAAAGWDGYGQRNDYQLPEGTDREIGAALAQAAGARAIGESLRSARELRAADYVGWPVSWLVERLTSTDPARKARLGRLWQQLRDMTAGPSGAQQAEIDNAISWVGNNRLPALPQPWSRTVRVALRSRADDIPAAVGAEIGSALPGGAMVDRWWRVIAVLQGLLLGCVLVGLAWLVTLLVLGTGRVATAGTPKLFADQWLLPWAAALIVVGVAAGWLTARICTSAVRKAAERETEELIDEIAHRMSAVARQFVVAPAELELAELAQFRAELRIAARGQVSA